MSCIVSPFQSHLTSPADTSKLRRLHRGVSYVSQICTDGVAWTYMLRTLTTVMQLRIATMVTAFVLTSCVGPASYDDQPNSIQRADILSKNRLGITIEHSTWGKKIAFRIAEEYCSSLGKAAVYRGASSQTGPDVISTWKCENE